MGRATWVGVPKTSSQIRLRTQPTRSACYAHGQFFFPAIPIKRGRGGGGGGGVSLTIQVDWERRRGREFNRGPEEVAASGTAPGRVVDNLGLPLLPCGIIQAQV